MAPPIRLVRTQKVLKTIPDPQIGISRAINMYRSKSVAVVIPAYDEEELIGETLLSIPEYVDNVYAVDDCSSDRTRDVIRNYAQKDRRIHPVLREKNGGVGAAIVSGFKGALKDKNELIAIMAGDNQMDPEYLPTLLDPIVDGTTDFTKGNRLKPGYWKGMSKWRLFGNLLLNVLNKIASGYWDVSDPQNGYVVISSDALSKLDLDELYPRYAFENDMMIKSNVAGIHMMNVYVPARYGNEKSHIRYGSFTVKTSIFLLKSFIWRVGVKFLQYQHPIYLTYALGMLLMALGSVAALFGEWRILPLGIVLFVIACISEAKQTIRPVTDSATDPIMQVNR
jgi:glycosyltransferase involved in cell wall biosynthesis